MQSDLEIAVQNIENYDAELDQSLGNVAFLRDGVADVRDDVQIVERALSKIEDFRNEVNSFGADIDKLKLIFSLMGKASPLKTISDVGLRMLKNVENVIDRIDDKIESVADRIENSNITTTLRDIDTNLGKFDEALASVEGQISEQKASFGTVAEIAGKLATFSTAAIEATGDVVAVPLSVIQEINDVFDDMDSSDTDSVKELLLSFDSDVPSGDFNAFLDLESELGQIFDRLDAIRGPLDVVYSVIKPIEPLLSAVDFVASITVDPVIDFVLNTLGADKIINAASSRITALLPDTGVLDKLDGALDFVEVAIDNFDLTNISSFDFDKDGEDDPDPFNLGDFIFNQLQSRLMEVAETAAGEVIDEASQRIGAVNANGGIAIEIPQGVEGADDDNTLIAGYLLPGASGDPLDPNNPNLIKVSNLIMIGDRESNTIIATGGDNTLYGAEGDDTLFGADGMDTAVFTGPIEQYQFSRESDTSPITVEHVSPIAGVSLDGRDVLHNIERVSFLGGASGTTLTLSIDDLFDQVESVAAGGQVNRSNEGDANGDGQIDSVFLFATGGVSGGETTLRGGGGDDLISGSAGADLMVGNNGDDDFRFNGGVDTVLGGKGSDTFSIFNDPEGTQKVFVDLAEKEFIENPDNQAVLLKIENIRIDGKGNKFVLGNASANLLSSSVNQDLIDGRAGNDTIFGRGDSDVLIGGAGSDELYGGAGGDRLYAGDKAKAGRSDFYDGGDGNDQLNYSSDLTDPFNEAFLSSEGRLQSVRDGTLSSNSVRIFAGEGRVERLSANGQQVVSEDRFESIEDFVGSDFNDTLHGGFREDGVTARSLSGGEGDDVIYVEHTMGGGAGVSGGNGNDTVFANVDVQSTVTSNANGPSYDGGGNTDTLVLSQSDAFRWEVIDDNSTSGQTQRLRAFAVNESETGDEDSDRHLISFTLEGFENYIGSSNDDIFRLHRRNDDHLILAGDGNDFIEVESSNNSTYEVYGQGGDDKFELKGTAKAFGGEGDDEFQVNELRGSDRFLVDGGDGNDIVFVQKGQGFDDAGVDLDGGEDGLDDDGNEIIDNDILSAVVPDPEFGNGMIGPQGGLNINFLAGTVSRFGAGSEIDLTIANFETAIGSDDHADLIGGGADGDRLIGAGGNDILEGRAGGQALPNVQTLYSVDYDPALEFAESWTLEAVISTEVDSAAFQRIVSKPIGGQQTFSLAVHNGMAHVRFDTGNNGGARSLEAGFVADGSEHRLAGRYNEATGTLDLFVDGLLVASRSLGSDQPRTSVGEPVTIGYITSNFSQSFQGEIDEVRVWDVARSDSEIAQDFDAITDPTSEADLQLNYVNTDDGPIDQSQNGFDFNVIDQSSGNDLLYGGDGIDSLYGGDGDDLLHGGAGSDLLEGGAGTDTASYAHAAPGADRGAFEVSSHALGGVSVRLTDGTASQRTGGSGPIDTLRSIENVIGSASDDFILGDDKDNSLDAGEGADFVSGLGGNDRISILGDDTALGGLGDDYFTLSAGNSQIVGGQGVDTLRFDDSGTVLYDTATSQYRSEFVTSRAVWADTMTDELRAGFSPQDVLETDPAFVNSSDDIFRIIPDEPQFNITLTNELSQFSGTFGDMEVYEGGLAVSFTAGFLDDVLAGLSEENVISGLSGNDTIFGGGGDDELRGDEGNDVLNGDGGRDFLFGGDGNDRLDAGGRDGNTFQRMAGQAGDDTYVYGTVSGRVLINATAEIAGGGSDTIEFTDLNASDLEARTTTSSGANGVQLDLLWDVDDENGILRLANLGAQIEAFSFADGIFSQILSADGSGTAHSNFANTTVTTGVQTNDVLLGGEGRDFLYGGGGNDLLNAGGRDGDTLQRLFGEAGDDIYVYGPDSGRVWINANGEQANGGMDTIVLRGLNVSDVTFSTNETSGADGIRLDLMVQDGFLRLANLGVHIEKYEFEDATFDQIFFADGSGTPHPSFGDTTVTTGGNGDDLIVGGAGRDFLFGGAGNDRLDVGGRDGDTFQRMAGQSGDDTYIYSKESGRVVINSSGEVAGGGHDTISFSDLSVEDITLRTIATSGSDGTQLDLLWNDGSDSGILRLANLGEQIEHFAFTDVSFDQILTADGSGVAALNFSNTTITTGDSGADLIVGGDGRDFVYGGSGDDRLDAGGRDGDTFQRLFGEGGDDTYIYSKASGRVLINANGETEGGGSDTIVFTDLNISDITARTSETSGDDGVLLDLQWDDGTTSGILRLANAGEHIESFEFADGSVVDSSFFLF